MNQRRSRGRNNNGNNNSGGNRGGRPSPRNQSFDSNGPEGRVRGSATQVLERYLAQARDAQTAGDGVLAENLFQHAEHYYRVLSAHTAQAEQQQRERAQYEERRGNRNQGEGENTEASDREQGREQGREQAETKLGIKVATRGVIRHGGKAVIKIAIIPVTTKGGMSQDVMSRAGMSKVGHHVAQNPSQPKVLRTTLPPSRQA